MDNQSAERTERSSFFTRSLSKKRTRTMEFLTDKEPSALWDIENTDVDYHLSKLKPGEQFNFYTTLRQPKSRRTIYSNVPPVIPNLDEHSFPRHSFGSRYSETFLQLPDENDNSCLLEETKRKNKKFAKFLDKFNREIEQIDATELRIVRKPT